MLKRLFRSGSPSYSKLHGSRSPLRRWSSRIPRLPRQARFALLVLTLAAFLDVFLHARNYTVHQPVDDDLDVPFYTSCQEPKVDAPREKAAMVMLVRNKELYPALKTVQSIERHFNQWFHYPIVFLNDEPWSEDFISVMNATVSGEARFEILPKGEWGFPEGMDVESARDSMAAQGRSGVMYGGMETYHHMCRFYSGKFYTLDALKDYKWYWRIEPDVDYYCSLTYDPFAEMAKHGKVYGYTIALSEEPRTCPSLFREMADWKEDHGIETTELWNAMIAPSWVPWPFRSLMSWFSHRDAQGDGWNLCHYWSNFEIASLDFFRGRAYQDMYEHLDKTGRFYSERWGDAAIHALALAMLLPPEKVHHFEDVGYRHDWYYQCPANAPGGQLLESATLGDDRTFDQERPGGIGCRCECDGSRTRNYPSYCHKKLKQPSTTKVLSQWEWTWSRWW